MADSVQSQQALVSPNAPCTNVTTSAADFTVTDHGKPFLRRITFLMPPSTNIKSLLLWMLGSRGTAETGFAALSVTSYFQGISQVRRFF